MENNDMDRLIGKRVREERKRRNLTLEDLAEICSMSVSYLGYVERGQRPASLSILKKLSAAFRTPLVELLSTVKPKALTKEDGWNDLMKLAPLLRNQEPEERKRIIHYWKDSFQKSKALFSNLK
jgi:transcriptional regulator with XRE-family HTH domain